VKSKGILEEWNVGIMERDHSGFWILASGFWLYALCPMLYAFPNPQSQIAKVPSV
jgi:hypothetical protein